jgi:ABC-2 type transport system permease protein
MTNIFTIFRKELNSYFNSPIAYLVMALFGILSGYFFYLYVAFFVEGSMRSQMMGRNMPMDVNDMVIRQFLANLSVIGLFMIPMITMRLFAEEKRSGTIELLTTSPVRDIEIILGKWLAALTLYIAVLAISALSVASLFLYGRPDIAPILTGYLGLILQGGSLLAVGTLISTLTRNQIIAAFATFAVSLLLWVLDAVSAVETSAWAKAVAYLSVLSHAESFAKGVLETRDIVYYVSLTFFALFLTARSLESHRWRA